MEVYLVYVIYQYDGYDDTEVYSTREKALDAADQLLLKFQHDGYKINLDYADENTTFSEKSNDDLIRIGLSDADGDVEITVEKKKVY